MSTQGSTTRMRILCPLEPGATATATSTRKLIASFDPTTVTVQLLVVHDGKQAAEAAARDAVSAGASSLRAAGFVVEQELSVGHPAEEIIARADALESDLIMIGSRPAQNGNPGFSGRVASGVARHAPCSVLIARDDVPIGSIVLGYDLSPDAVSAVSLLARLPFRNRPPVAVCTAYEVVAPFDSGIAPTVIAQVQASRIQDLHEARSVAEATADDAARQLRVAGFETTIHTRHGRPSEQLAIVSADLGADLISVGSRGLSGIERFLLGSTSSELVAIAPRSLLIART